MRFKISDKILTASNRYLLYRRDEYSFDVEPASVDGYTSILLNLLSLEISKSGKLVSVWGLCPYLRWIDKILTVPKAESCELIMEELPPLRRGVSLELSPQRFFSTYVDTSLGAVQICAGASPEPESWVTPIPGVIFAIGAGGEFSSLWLQPQSGIRNIASAT